MSYDKRTWIDIGSVLALVIGLGLVYVQIKQSSQITRIQLETSIAQNWRTVDATRQGEEFSKVLAKSIENPEEITLDEFLELDAYYLGVLDQLEIMAGTYESGYRETSLDNTIANNSKTYFGNAFAKSWVNKHFSNLTSRNEAWVKTLLKEVNNVDSDTTQEKYLGVLGDIETLTPRNP